jgi:nucleoside 2-deoxyribosyltransferase
MPNKLQGDKMGRIVLCSSASFFDKLWDIKAALEQEGHEVYLPSMKDYHHIAEGALAKIAFNLIKEHFKRIDQSDAIYVANFDKNGIHGYIGGNTFLEMGKAFDKGIPIFVMNDIPEKVSYREELLAMRPIVIGLDWSALNEHILEKKGPQAPIS